MNRTANRPTSSTIVHQAAFLFAHFLTEAAQWRFLLLETLFLHVFWHPMVSGLELLAQLLGPLNKDFLPLRREGDRCRQFLFGQHQ